MTTDAPAKRFPLGLTIATAIALAILIGLGTWQLQRLAWKEALLERVAALQAAPAQPLEHVIDSVAFGADRDFTRVEADCPGLGKAPYLELYSVRDVGAGVRIISACRIPAGKYDYILVDRGFISDQVSARPPVDGGLHARFQRLFANGRDLSHRTAGRAPKACASPEERA